MAYALYCVGQESLYTYSLKSEASSLSSTSSSTMVVWSGCLLKQQLEVDESLFWLQTSVQAFLINTIEAQHGR